MSHCYRSDSCSTCIARLLQFKVVAVATQPRFHHIQHLNEVTVGLRCLGYVQTMFRLYWIDLEAGSEIDPIQCEQCSGKSNLTRPIRS